MERKTHPEFDLVLSAQRIAMMHCRDGCRELVGAVDPESEDFAAQVRTWLAKAEAREPEGIRTRLIIPNDQVRYLTLELDANCEEAIHAGIQEVLGTTAHCNFGTLVYDFAVRGAKTYVAAVPVAILNDAEAFTRAYGFNPVGFAAVPPDHSFPGQPDFGRYGTSTTNSGWVRGQVRHRPPQFGHAVCPKTPHPAKRWLSRVPLWTHNAVSAAIQCKMAGFRRIRPRAWCAVAVAVCTTPGIALVPLFNRMQHIPASQTTGTPAQEAVATLPPATTITPSKDRPLSRFGQTVPVSRKGKEPAGIPTGSLLKSTATTDPALFSRIPFPGPDTRYPGQISLVALGTEVTLDDTALAYEPSMTVRSPPDRDVVDRTSLDQDPVPGQEARLDPVQSAADTPQPHPPDPVPPPNAGKTNTIFPAPPPRPKGLKLPFPITVRDSDTLNPRKRTPTNVAKQATTAVVLDPQNGILLGISGKPPKRKAVVLLPSNNVVVLTVGDTLNGGKIIAIGANQLRYVKNGRNLSMRVPDHRTRQSIHGERAGET